MALEWIRDAALANLRTKGASPQTQLAYLERFDETARDRPEDPLPCPSCFLLGLTARLKPVPNPRPKIAAVRCALCQLEFKLPDPG